MPSLPRLAIVVPCYNEEEVLPETHHRLHEVLQSLIDNKEILPSSFMLFVDDGSKDKTWSIIDQFHREDKFVFGLKLSRNRGHQNALLAGLMNARDLVDATISIDADLQDDVTVIGQMVKKFKDGFDVVYGVRSDRKSDSFFKRTTALGFYKLMQKLGTKSVYNHADYRLLSQRALNELARFNEVNLFLRGIVPLIGFPSTTVEYVRHERFAGESKYSLKKMLSFAVDGVTSFSVEPINLIFKGGVFLLTLTGLGLITAIAFGLLGYTLPWLDIITWILMSGLTGILLVALATVGTYVGKIYSEVKARPRYGIEAFLKHEVTQNEEPSLVEEPKATPKKKSSVR